MRNTFLAIFLTLTLSNCGGGGGTTEYIAGGTVKVSCSKSATEDGVTATIKAGFNGDLGFDCVTDVGVEHFFFQSFDGINVQNVIRSLSVSATCDAETLTLENFLDYSTSTVNILGVSSVNGPTSCAVEFPPINLPTVIDNDATVESLFTYATEANRALTNSCPDDNTLEVASSQDTCTSFSGIVDAEYNILDTQGKEHTVAFQITIKK